MTAGMISGGNGQYRLDSNLTFATASETFAEGEKLLKADHGPLTIDLNGTKEADSAALAVLLGWRRLAGPERRLQIVNPPPGLRALAQLYGVTELIFPD